MTELKEVPDQLTIDAYQFLGEKGLSELDIKLLADAYGKTTAELLTEIKILQCKPELDGNEFNFEAIQKLADQINASATASWFPIDFRYQQALDNLRNLVR